jgi:hypothetical protein
MIIEGPGSGTGSGSGSIPLTSGSGSRSGRPKNMWIRIRIRRNTAQNEENFSIPSTEQKLWVKLDYTIPRIFPLWRLACLFLLRRWEATIFSTLLRGPCCWSELRGPPAWSPFNINMSMSCSPTMSRANTENVTAQAARSLSKTNRL